MEHVIRKTSTGYSKAIKESFRVVKIKDLSGVKDLGRFQRIEHNTKYPQNMIQRCTRNKI